MSCEQLITQSSDNTLLIKSQTQQVVNSETDRTLVLEHSREVILNDVSDNTLLLLPGATVEAGLVFSNIGGGAEVFAEQIGNTVNLRTLSGDDSIDVSQASTLIEFSANTIDAGTYS